MSPLVAEIVDAAERLVEAIARDEAGGSIIMRETLRQADELRVLLIRWRRAFRK